MTPQDRTVKYQCDHVQRNDSVCGQPFLLFKGTACCVFIYFNSILPAKFIRLKGHVLLWKHQTISPQGSSGCYSECGHFFYVLTAAFCVNVKFSHLKLYLLHFSGRIHKMSNLIIIFSYCSLFFSVDDVLRSFWAVFKNGLQSLFFFALLYQRQHIHTCPSCNDTSRN